MKCTKCQQDVPVENGVNTQNGFVCHECIKKTKRKKTLIIIACVLLLLIGGGVVYLVQQKKLTALGFGGVTSIEDSVNVSIDKPIVSFNIGEAVAQANPVIAGQTIDDIASFKRVFAENVEEAKKANSATVVIPSIGVLFDFSSFTVSQASQDLLNEYANAYLRTNKEAVILVEGFTCNIGTPYVNDWISEQRAKSVQHALISLGIPENKIEVKWYGKSRFNEFKYSSKSEYRRVILSIK